jgi:hypothetical protein
LSKSELKEVGSDKEGEEKKIFMDKERIGSAICAQGYTEHDKKAGNGVNPVINNHDVPPFFVHCFF